MRHRRKHTVVRPRSSSFPLEGAVPPLEQCRRVKPQASASREEQLPVSVLMLSQFDVVACVAARRLDHCWPVRHLPNSEQESNEAHRNDAVSSKPVLGATLANFQQQAIPTGFASTSEPAVREHSAHYLAIEAPRPLDLPHQPPSPTQIGSARTACVGCPSTTQRRHQLGTRRTTCVGSTLVE